LKSLAGQKLPGISNFYNVLKFLHFPLQPNLYTFSSILIVVSIFYSDIYRTDLLFIFYEKFWDGSTIFWLEFIFYFYSYL